MGGTVRLLKIAIGRISNDGMAILPIMEGIIREQKNTTKTEIVIQDTICTIITGVDTEIIDNSLTFHVLDAMVQATALVITTMDHKSRILVTHQSIDQKTLEQTFIATTEISHEITSLITGTVREKKNEIPPQQIIIATQERNLEHVAVIMKMVHDETVQRRTNAEGLEIKLSNLHIIVKKPKIIKTMASALINCRVILMTEDMIKMLEIVSEEIAKGKKVH